MDKTVDLLVITTNAMESDGFKFFFEQNKPGYKVALKLLPAYHSFNDIYDLRLKKDGIIIFDTDSFAEDKLVDCLEEIKRYGIKCIIYSRLSTPGLVIKARELFINGYISKSSPLSRLLNCLNVIELGGNYYDECFSELIKEIMDFEETLSLTQRRFLHEILLFSSRSIRDLSNALNISKHTVEVHLSNLYKKAEVSNYNELISRFSL